MSRAERLRNTGQVLAHTGEARPMQFKQSEFTSSDQSRFKVAAEGEDARQARGRPEKSASAFRTISEVADELEVPQHVLRFWESKFTQIRPLKRGGGRRYYRPEDIELLRVICSLLYDQGYTIKGVQKLLREGGIRAGNVVNGDGAALVDSMSAQAVHGIEAAVPLVTEGADKRQDAAITYDAVPPAVEDLTGLPLFRASLTENQVREINAVRQELASLRERLRSLLD